MFRASNAVAVQDLDGKTGQQLRQSAAQGLHDGGQAHGVVLDQFLHHREFNPIDPSFA